MSVFPLLVARSMLQRGCRVSLAETIREIVTERPEIEAEILWLRIQNYSYGDISKTLRINKGTVWRLINGRIKATIYSVILGYSN